MSAFVASSLLLALAVWVGRVRDRKEDIAGRVAVAAREAVPA